MKKIWIVFLMIGLFVISALAQNLNYSNNKKQGSIENVIIIVKENRAFDHYFGKYPGVNGATKGKDLNDNDLPLGKAANEVKGNLVIGWGAAHDAYNNGKMNGFGKYSDPSIAYTQYDKADIRNYWAYADNFALCDNFFSEMLGPTFPNKLYLVAGWAGGADGNPVVGGNLFDYIKPWGWDQSESTTVEVFDAVTKQYTNVVPHWDFPTIIDKIKAVGYSWREFCPIILGYKFSMFGPIKHIYNTDEYKSTDDNKTCVFDLQRFDEIIKSKGLANVTYVQSSIALNMPSTAGSEHPPLGVCEGEDFSVGVVNSVMNSPYWNKCAIFVFWDDYGGFYDHAPPPQVDAYGLGFRVPCLIISPYVKKGVQKQQFEFASVNKLIKSIFKTDGFLSSRDSLANDMLSCFDFNQTPLPKLVLPILGCPRPPETDVDDYGKNEIPGSFKLNQNYPNPFNSFTNIEFQIPEDCNVTIKIYDETGREVGTALNIYLHAGYYPYRFDASKLPSGTYIYKVSAGKYTDEKKMMLLK